MRVAYLTSGAGGMYCGSCMRDNTLAAALRRKGRDLVLLPVYTPIRTDEEDVSDGRVFYGGINVFLQQKSAFFRHTPWLIDRVLDRPGLLRSAMKRAGKTKPEDLGALTISILKGEEGAQRKELKKLIAALNEIRPAIVHLPNAFFVGLAKAIRAHVRVPVVCTLTGEDIFLDRLPGNARAEVQRLIGERGRDVDGFLCVTRHYAEESKRRFRIAPERIHHVPLGIKLEPAQISARTSGSTRSFRIGYFARICPEKGLHVLCEAFKILRREGRDCTLHIAGYLDPAHQSYHDDIRNHLSEEGLAPHVQYAGEVDRQGKLEFLRSLDVFSVPTVYPEAKGIYVLEALSQGVPVVLPRQGSFPELIEATGGGLLVEPHDPAELARGIARLMDNAEERRRFGEQGQAKVRAQFSDEVMADSAWDVFRGYVEKGRAAPAITR